MTLINREFLEDRGIDDDIAKMWLRNRYDFLHLDEIDSHISTTDVRLKQWLENLSKYEFDTDGNITRKPHNGGMIDLTYKDKLLVTEVWSSNISFRQKTFEYEYKNELMIHKKLTTGNTSQTTVHTYYEYDSNGNVILEYSNPEYKTRFLYDPDNNLIATMLWTGCSILNKYNDKGLVTITVDESNVLTNTDYQSNGLLAMVSSSDGVVKCYDIRGNLIVEKSKERDVPSISLYEYDDIGNMIHNKPSSGTGSTFEYQENEHKFLIYKNDELITAILK